MDPNVELFPGVGHTEEPPKMTERMPWKQTLQNPVISEASEANLASKGRQASDDDDYGVKTR